MAKIIRLTEADLTRIVRQVIKEQSSPKPLPMTKPSSNPKPLPLTGPSFKGKTVNLYKDQPNTQLYRKITIMKEPFKDYGGEVLIYFGTDQEMKYNCTKPNLFTITETASPKKLSFDVFNNQLTQDFFAKFCQVNRSNRPVPKADYASNDSQSGSNIA